MENHFTSFNSKYGNIVILWNQSNGSPKITRLYLKYEEDISFKNLKGRYSEMSCNIVDETIYKIQSYFSGDLVDFDLNTIDLDICSGFQKIVLLAEFNIPRGYVSTYNRIADHIKKPGSARAVGNALARNPFPIIIPCHRAIRSDGSLGGYQGGIRMKYELLRMEGIVFNKNKKVLFEQVFY